MIETIKHLLGICGEGHPSLLWGLIGGSGILYYLKHNIQWCWKKGCDMCMSKIKQLKK